MDTRTIEQVTKLLETVAEQEGMQLNTVIVFGSRARDDYTERSDIDLLIVSPDFEDTAWNKRPGPFYEAWDYDTLPTPEFICLTPDEYDTKKQKNPHIVRKAAEEGVTVA